MLDVLRQVGNTFCRGIENRTKISTKMRKTSDSRNIDSVKMNVEEINEWDKIISPASHNDGLLVDQVFALLSLSFQ